MKKEVLNILFLAAVVLSVVWLYWPSSDQDKSGSQKQAGSSEHLVLALSWQPAFCERKPNKPECRTQRANRFDATHFSLHGLWPQPRSNVYCNLDQALVQKDKRGRWNELPKLDLSDALRKELALVMPGYRSNLHRHEWYKHGVCMEGDANPQTYYQVSIDKLKKINTSGLANFMAGNIGREVSVSQLQQIVDQNIERGAGKRLSISCRQDGNRLLISEIRVNVAIGQSDIDTDWIMKAPERKPNCKRGIVDPVGLQ